VWILAEETVRAFLWFNPAVWWALAQIHLCREQLVDRLVIARTGLRRAYMNALLHFAGARPAFGAIPFLHRRHFRSRITHLSREVTMSRKRFVAATSVLSALTVGATLLVMMLLPLNVRDVLAQGTAGQLEIRLAEVMAGNGLTPARTQSGQTVYLHAEVIASQNDIASARVVNEGSGYSVAIELNGVAAGRMTRATSAHIGRPLAVLLDGRLITAPVIRSPVGASALLTGNFSKAEADEIAAALGRQAVYDSADPSIVLPTVIASSKPQYVKAAMDLGITGDVLVSAVVNADGLIRRADIKQSLDTVYGLDRSALDSTREWRFNPGTRDGVPVPVRVHLLMTFRLK
jgi:TonB family protein